MAAAHLHAALDRLRRISSAADASEVGDQRLLQRFLENRDEAAFQCLVRRHGPMIMGVCRRILGNVQDAEDAFQATFLVLVRKAGSVSGAALPAWLHNVAYRTALGARTANLRRQAKERKVARRQANEPDLWQDYHELLDRELAGLPDRYRNAIVLCDLEGKSRKDAARQLGWKEGTLSGRLSRGRALLARRLSKHGPALSVSALAALLTQQLASGELPAALISASSRAAAAMASGSASAVSAEVIFLTEGALRAMATAKLKVGVVILFLGGLFGAAGLLAYGDRISHQVGSPRSPHQRPQKHVELTAGHPPLRKQKPFHPYYDDEKLRKALARGVDFLKSSQTADGHWEFEAGKTIKGGWTGLVVLALLKSGVPAEDPALKRGLYYLRNLKPDFTYAVSLQTAVFANAQPRKDLPLMRRNVAWLLDAAVRKHGRVHGWSYRKQELNKGDNSNTQFAVMALHEAHEAGVKIDAGVWKEIQKYYLDTQMADGGWPYDPQLPLSASLTMTAAGICGLAITSKHLDNSAQVKKALDNANRYMSSNFQPENPRAVFYSLHVLGRAGRLLKQKEFAGPEKHDWFHEGADFLLRSQQQNGAWRANQAAWDRMEVVSTSLALLFCAQGK